MRPILFSLGPIHVYGYGTMIVLGGVLSVWLWHRRAALLGFQREDDLWLMVNVMLASGLIGMRLLYLFEYTVPFSAEFWRTLFSVSGGLSILGCFFSLPLGLWFFCRSRGLSFGRVMDGICAVAPFWHMLGRFGCLLAGCCYGLPTGKAWGIVFHDPRSMVPPAWLGVPLHPTQLYEAVCNLLIGLALYRLWGRRPEPPGLVTGLYFGAYGALRFVEEYYRGDAVAFALGLTAGQALSLGLIALSAAIIAGRTACTRRC